MKWFLSATIFAAAVGCAVVAPRSNGDRAWWDTTPTRTENLQDGEPARLSHYVPMSDGTKLAVTVYHPKTWTVDTVLPTILLQTRYYRAFAGRWPFRGSVEKASELVRRFVQSGYVFVAVDVRGTGASFGTNPYPWSKREIADGSELVDWIIRQPWSNGKVGATGISYDGTSADFLLSTRHPAVKAIAPRFSLFDAYSEIAFPGGIFNRWFVKHWAEGNQALDSNEFHRTLGVFPSLALRGVLPVDDDIDGTQLRAAIKEHQANKDIYAEARRIVFRDDRAPAEFTVDEISPFSVANELTKTNKPILSMSGWLDGGYANAAIKRYLNVPNLGSRLVLGPWDHGGRQNISPKRLAVDPSYDQVGELIRFFNSSLQNERSTGRGTSDENEPSIFYYTMVEERWKGAECWPPATTEHLTYFLAGGNKLSTTRPTDAAASDVYRVDLSTGTGSGSRWRSLFNIDRLPIGYPDRTERDKALLVYDSPALPTDIEITGHPLVQLYVNSSASDGNLFVYLEEVDPKGKVTYITDGQLRLIHRQINEDDPLYNTPTPQRTFRRADASLLAKGEIAEARFDLLPVSYLVRKGHRIRIAIAGADKDYFSQTPVGESPTLRFYRTKAYDSWIQLPIIPRP